MKVIGLFAFGLVLSACGSSGLNRPVQEVTARTDSDGVQRVRVMAHSFWFEPNRVVVHAGKPVELDIKNGSVFVPHNLTCTAPETDVTISENLGMFRGHKTARFTPTTPGEYHFYCHVDGHAKKGMSGTLVVLAP
jgi:plastocyanin